MKATTTEKRTFSEIEDLKRDISIKAALIQYVVTLRGSANTGCELGCEQEAMFCIEDMAAQIRRGIDILGRVAMDSFRAQKPAPEGVQ